MKTIQLYYSAIICLGLFILNLEGCSRQHNFSVSQKTKNLQPFNESNEPNELIKVWVDDRQEKYLQNYSSW